MAIETLKLGLIGAGRIGRLHAEHVQRRMKDAQIAVITDAVPAAAAACAKDFGIPETAPDFRAILARKEIHGVVVCSPTDTHTQIIEEAAAAGKHVFCEKPIDADLARIDRALAAVRQAGVILQVGFNRRFDANFQRVRRAIVSGEIGTPHQIHVISRDPGPPPIEYVRRSGGLFMDMTIHDFDMVRFLAGDEVVEVYATGGVRVDPAIGEAGDIDTAVILLKFQGGATGMIENCRKAVYGYDQRVEVLGSAGAIRIDNNYPNTAVVSTRDHVRRDLPLNFFMERYVESYLEEVRLFLEAIRTGAPSPLSGEEGRVPVQIAQAATRSLRENRPVALSEIK
ncbi:MAG: inositol 2-dehydrogenase [Verrucomicrobiales bacterium]|nr:inositol 2-dehydrogenase [Verrucomicrobiales bacterium]